MCQSFLQLASYTLILLSCLSSPQQREDTENGIISGAEQTAIYFDSLKDQSVALVINQTSMVEGVHILDTMLHSGISVRKILTPEHGFRGTADAGTHIDNTVDSATGLPIISLYGDHKKPSPEDLEGIDIIVFDIQDVGVRFYTYISTLHYVMEAAAEQDIPLIVLDRPNPNRRIVDGPVLEPSYSSFVGMHPVPVAYGLTIGEYALMINGEAWLSNGIKCDLRVIPCKGYKGTEIFSLEVKPSPNLPNKQSVALYPGLCFFEGTTMSIGRGTDFPFQVVGHPGLKECSFSFTPVSGPGARYPKHENQLCHGLDLRQAAMPVDTIPLSYILMFYKKAQREGIPFFNENNFFEKLAGTSKLRRQIESGATVDDIRQSWQKDLENFKRKREKYLLYSL